MINAHVAIPSKLLSRLHDQSNHDPQVVSPKRQDQFEIYRVPESSNDVATR